MERRNEYHVSQEDGAMYTVVRWDGDGMNVEEGKGFSEQLV